MKLVLGTAQLGLDYGIANQCGRVERTDAQAILSVARHHGIDMLDTAIAYGSSEAVLGTLGINDWRVITKLPPIPEKCRDISAWVDEQLTSSLQRLGIPTLYGLLLHRPDQLQGNTGDALFDALQQQQSNGRVNKIGISIYQPAELDVIFAQRHFDLVQAPFNIIDRRLAESGWLQKLHDRNVEVHVRSVFLQGLLLMPADKRPAKFNRWRSLWENWSHWLAENCLTPLQACMCYAMAFSQISKVVVGVESASQLEQIMTAASGVLPPIPESLQSHDHDLLDPSRWDQL